MINKKEAKEEKKTTKKKKPVKEVKYNVSKTSDMNFLINKMKMKYNVDLIVNNTDIIKFGNSELVIIFNKV